MLKPLTGQLFFERISRADSHPVVRSEQVYPVLQESVSGLAGQRERAVLVVGDARVPQ